MPAPEGCGLVSILTARPSKQPKIKHSTYINAPPSVVYRVITTGDGWDSWFTNGTTVDRRNRRIMLRWKDFGPEHVTTSDGGKIVRMVKDREFVFQWSPGSAPTEVTLLLRRAGKGTVVEVTESGYRRTDEDMKAELGCATGWGEALTLLKFYLEYGVTYGKVPATKPR